jgi:cysteine desulfurase family protein
MLDLGVSPGRGGYSLTIAVANRIEELRASLAQLFKAEHPRNLIFTANATESLNLALQGLLQPGDHVITSPLEHNAVLRPLNYLKAYRGIEISFLSADSFGQIRAEEISALRKSSTKAVVVTHVSNVSGTILPVAEIGDLCRRYELIFILDAAQSAGALPIDVKAMHLNLLAFTGHKSLYGPPGTGGLYISPGIDLYPLKQGGSGVASELEMMPQELPYKYESGTPNSVGLFGLKAGVDYIEAQGGIAALQARYEALTGYFIRETVKFKGISVYGPAPGNPRAAVVSINVEGWEPQELSALLDQKFGIMTRAGLHCAPLAHKVLGTYPSGTVRFSFSAFNTIDEIDYALKALKTITK